MMQIKRLFPKMSPQLKFCNTRHQSILFPEGIKLCLPIRNTARISESQPDNLEEPGNSGNNFAFVAIFRDLN